MLVAALAAAEAHVAADVPVDLAFRGRVVVACLRREACCGALVAPLGRRVPRLLGGHAARVDAFDGCLSAAPAGAAAAAAATAAAAAAIGETQLRTAATNAGAPAVSGLAQRSAPARPLLHVATEQLI